MVEIRYIYTYRIDHEGGVAWNRLPTPSAYKLMYDYRVEDAILCRQKEVDAGLINIVTFKSTSK